MHAAQWRYKSAPDHASIIDLAAFHPRQSELCWRKNQNLLDVPLLNPQPPGNEP